MIAAETQLLELVHIPEQLGFASNAMLCWKAWTITAHATGGQGQDTEQLPQ